MNKQKLMKRAWEIAKNGAKKFGGKVREYFSIALSIAWKELKNMTIELKKVVEFTVGTPKQIKWANDIRNRIIIAAEKYIVPNIEEMKRVKLRGVTESDIEFAIDEYLEKVNSIAEETSAKAIIENYKHIRTELDGLKIFSHDDIEISVVLSDALKAVYNKKGELLI